MILVLLIITLTLVSLRVFEQIRRPYEPWRSVELAFYERNYAKLVERYVDQWIIIEGKRVVASDKREFIAVEKARALGIQVPFVFYIESPDAPPFIF